jgi:hypothetical protein
MLEYGRESRDSFELESKGKNAEEPRNRAEWAKAIAGEVFKRAEARSKEVKLANGEALPTGAEKILHDTLTVPDLASVEASFERTRLLLQQGPGVAAMAVDASASIQSRDSLEKMLAHQLAAAHKVTMEMIESVVPHSHDTAIQNKRLNAAVRCMAAYQKGLLTLRKLRLGGHQRISVQHIQVREGGQAIVGDVVNN